MNNNIPELKEARKNHRANENNIVIAAVLIMAGIALLVNSMTDHALEHWWALFMLIPAGFMFMNVWRDYQENGRFTHKSIGVIIPGVIILTMVVIFLFNLSWAILWPAAIIAVGLSILLSGRK